MTFEIGKCWDCPVPLLTVFLQVIGGLAAVTLGMFLIKKGRPRARYAGTVTLILAFFWYFFVAMSILRFGIFWNERVAATSQMATWRMVKLADVGVIITWLLATFAAVHRLRRQPAVV